MGIKRVDTEKFLDLANQYPVIDVRSPGEYKHAQIPNAYSLPLFSDDERKVVGTTYKQQSREDAIKIGLDFFGVKMKKMLEETEGIIKDSKNAKKRNTILLYCWRGGMRSAGVAWLLDMYGFKVYTLIGGYKAFRNWALKQFEKEYNLKILGGYTGSGKTPLLKELKNNEYEVVDLEGLANHKGSAFGAIEEAPQPSQEMFENLLALKLFIQAKNNKEIWLEDESQRIGKMMIPHAFWETMRNSPVYFLDIPFEERLNYLEKTYGCFEKVKLKDAIFRIQKRLGRLETKNAINFLEENNIKECFRILLKYYDKLYSKGLQNRKNYESLLNIISCTSVNTSTNIKKLSLQEV